MHVLSQQVAPQQVILHPRRGGVRGRVSEAFDWSMLGTFATSRDTAHRILFCSSDVGVTAKLSMTSKTVSIRLLWLELCVFR